MSGPHTTLAVTEDGIALVTLVNPPVNSLHPTVLQSLFNHLREAQARQEVKAIVITGANGRFCAGFDINQFVQSSGGGGIDAHINDAFCDLIESGPKPTVAAVQTMALGGGCELALACNARVCTPGTSFGLPELQLGIIPGFGGTQRLPRAVGLQKAVEMMLTSTPIKDRAARELGLADEVVPPGQLLEVAKRVAFDIAAGKRARVQTLYRTDKLEPLGEALAILQFARSQAAKRARHLMHPLLCLDAIQYGIEHGGRAGLQKEGECFGAAAALDTHKALVHIFFAQRSTKKIRGVTDTGLRPRPIKRVAVLGGGLMGSGIATACVLAGVEVLLKEVNQKFLDAGMGRIQSNLASRVKKGRMTEQMAQAAMSRVQGALDYSGFGSVDMVIEAAIEDVGLKQEIFAELERSCRKDAILATNTSTINIELVGAKTSCADRILGAHFFSPAHVMPLLEIVRTDQTSKQVILDTLELSTKIKKTPVVVGNCTGFAVNRVFFPYTQAACMLVDMGLDPYRIDKIIAGFGMPMGPFRLSDLVGADIGLHVGKNFLESFSKRCYPARIIQLLNENKRLGEKSGRGFYKYDARRRASPDPDLAPLVQQSRKGAGLYQDGAPPPKMNDQDIVEFIFFPVVNEGCRVIDEGIVDKPADLDVAMVMGMGFPAFRGGLIFWADLVGADYICQRLAGWAKQFSGTALQGFFKPSAYLERCARQGTKLSAGKGAASKL
ncbi:hypothetical protein CHLNCDRAFT_59763 [Chlorella variabilis]|uniref:Uncharacterized protein n=1 Tax=Chlorella variabilis TaxID=554065 RepID=E1ZPC2_CHLVA|nr:hypothetical protein CHLNCDRAFT_59763 [Chlorella variabilis]EFN52227.1 hypothetical protein CHLNCDRAFT_59763 [Chlorella variabilis]|eukprot:XP_005844329.1 hypothetical protein CHLNCDRAFT_59763 [Chlorella variabilis]